jgi:asparagine synthase (glutamine-hydrolysing)
MVCLHLLFGINLKKKLTVVKDRMGVKPLYYSIYNETFYFASEQKALFTAGVPLKIADEGLQEYIFNRFVAGENTLYENISKVLPGHSMTLHQNGKIETEKWWDLKTEIQNQALIKIRLNGLKTL